MKALLSFSSALSDPLRLRILALACDHKISTAELAGVLKQSDSAIAPHVKQLLDAQLLKGDAKGEALRAKRKHAQIIGSLFSHFKISAKKDETLRSDAKALKALRSAKKAAPKTKPKAEKKVKTKPEGKAKSKGK